MSREISPKTRRLFKQGAADIRRQKEEQAAGRDRRVLAAEQMAAAAFAECAEVGSTPDAKPAFGQVLTRERGMMSESDVLSFWYGWDCNKWGHEEPGSEAGLAGWLLREMVSKEEPSE